MDDTTAASAAASEKKKSYLAQNSGKIMESLKNGDAPFLPGKDGVIKTEPVRSADTGKVFHGANQMLAQIYLRESGSEDKRVCTWDQAKKAGTFIKAGAKSFPLTVYNAETKESKVYHYFPVSETGKPSAFKTPDRARENQPKVPVVECKNSEPAKYLGDYFTALQLGAEFRASPETSKAFRENMIKDVAASPNAATRPFEIGNRASAVCRETIKDMYKEEWAQAKRQEYRQERETRKEKSGIERE